METHDTAQLCFPQLHNISCRKPEYSFCETVLLRLLLYFLSVVTVFLNLLVITAVSHYRQLQTPTNILLLSLAVSDLLVGLLIMPMTTVPSTGCWFLGDFLCIVLRYVTYLVTSASVGAMVLISIDRYVAVCQPLSCQSTVTERRAQLCVCLCWLCSVLYNILFIKDEMSGLNRYNTCYGKCVTVVDAAAGSVDLVLTFIAPVSVIVVLYTKVFVVAVSQARAMRSQVTAFKVQISAVKSKKSELKAARNLGVLILVFLLCFIPYYCISLLQSDFFENYSAGLVYYVFYFNSTINPLIYTLLYPWFRKSARLILTFRILEPGSRQAKII